MSEVYLTKRDPARNVTRFYRMFIAPSLRDKWTRFREWGRIGSSSGTIKSATFPNAGAALLAMQALLRAKRRRG